MAGPRLPGPACVSDRRQLADEQRESHQKPAQSDELHPEERRVVAETVACQIANPRDAQRDQAAKQCNGSLNVLPAERSPPSAVDQFRVRDRDAFT